jgi:hypothetical protein
MIRFVENALCAISSALKCESKNLFLSDFSASVEMTVE